VAVASDDDVAAAHSEIVDPDSVSFAPGTVLIADDVSANRELVKGFLDTHRWFSWKLKMAKKRWSWLVDTAPSWC